ncbi:DUF2971 domain-containing protein [Bradyrhizobium japonicum]|uniref:DUF2971 domain-containing protein n=1 Tax=Bradyrhizobium japonicum TaxID=375 RepID=A0A1Y2JQV5_BRAJP|nr:DUF2971 domain-containing protein [Bradyrhizobium japonicum]OSJ31967.1 hypothetical protein BSZ19_20400 [Bradyrhizobium japonicum]
MDQSDIDLARKVGRIFMPHAWKRRDEFQKAEGRYVHYTSAEAGLNIIRSKSIWMRNTTCMADYSEVQHGFAKLQSEDMLKGLLRWLDVELNGLGREAASLFDQWWNDTRFGTFIASISEHEASEDLHGRLSMWRAFGGQSARVAFVLKIPENPTVGLLLNLFISPVAYFRDNQLSTEISAVLQNVRESLEFLKLVDRKVLVGALFIMLVSASVCLKHEGFHEEKEWRIVYNPKRAHSDFMKSSIESVGGVPQLVYKIPIGGGPPDGLSEINIGALLDRLIIGPTQYSWAMYEAFVAALKDAGVEKAEEKVFVSGIPIRS